MKYLFIILTMSLSMSSATAQLRSAEALIPELSNQSYTVKLKNGFHFNDKAPNEVRIDGQKVKPHLLKARQIEFKWPHKNWKDGKASLYVCDDEITYCETHHIQLKGDSKSESTKPVSSKKKELHGFLVDDFPKALELAKTQKKLLLVDFSARWCPGCVRFEKETFPTKAFQSLTKDFVKVKIDVDLFSNFELTENFNIVGIPTLIVMTTDQEEIDRLVDFQPMDRLQAFFDSVKKDPTPTQKMIAQANTNPETWLRLGQRLMASGQFEKSIPYLEKIKPAPPELLYAKVMAAQTKYQQDNKQKSQYIDQLRKALQEETDSSRSIGWRAELVELIDNKSKEAQTLVSEGVKLADELMSSPEKMKAAMAHDLVGEFTGYEKLLLAIYKATLIEASEASEDDKTRAWQEAAKVGFLYKISPDQSGPALRYLIVMSSGKMWPQAEKYANEMLKKDPKNTDVKRRKLRILMAQDKFKEAIQLGESIIDEAEGRNQIWVAESLAKAYVGAKDKASARKLLTAFLARPEMALEKMKASRKSLESLLTSTQ